MPDSTTERDVGVLATKLNPPLIRSDVLDRPQLIARLEQDSQRSLTLFSAPAGYGKSTLAAQWLKTSALPGVWVSLDEGDSDLRTFLSYVVAAVRRVKPGACAGTHELLGASQLPPSVVIAKLLANELDTIRTPFLLVLDDLHLASDPDVHDLLVRLLQHPPRSLHLVVLTRRDPPFPVGTLKARGEAMELRETDLQFDAAETGAVLQLFGQISLDANQLAAVMNEIEGWITGLRLFSLASEKGDDPKVYLCGMRGGALHVQDYLVEQVLSRQSPELQECLLRTSILDRFCAPLCEAVCSASRGKKASRGTMSGQSFIETIVETNLFGIQLEASGEWIRYHHLFRDLLYNRLQRKWDLTDIASLHREAAKWFGAKGLVEEALKHAHEAGDAKLAALIIEAARLDALNTDKWPRLGKWLDTLPPGVENTRPQLLMGRAYFLMQSHRLTEIPAILDRIVDMEGECPSDPMLAGELNFFRGLLAFFMGEVEASGEHLKIALNQVPEANIECRAESEYFACVVLHLTGRHEQAVQGLLAAMQDESHSLFFRTRLVFGLSFVHALAGEWQESFRAAERLASFSQPNDLPYAVAWAVYMQANASLQIGDWETANHFFDQACERRYIKNRRAAIDALAGRALCLQHLGKSEQADASLQDAREFAYWTGDPTHLDVVDSCRARIALLRGDQDAASRWLAACHGKPEGLVRIFFLEYPEITACRVLIARGTPESFDQAAVQLDRLEAESRRFYHDCQLLPVLILQSVLFLKREKRARALGVLTEAVGLAWPGRWVLPFIEAGAPIAELLSQLSEQAEWGGFVPHVLTRLASALGLEPKPAPIRGTGHALKEALTNRELDVLDLLTERLYDKEIAERLGISLGTVKSHLKHIYGKLEVPNRRQAAAKAKTLGLLDR